MNIPVYDGDGDSAQAATAAAKQCEDRGHGKREIVRATLLFVSIAVAALLGLERGRRPRPLRRVPSCWRFAVVECLATV